MSGEGAYALRWECEAAVRWTEFDDVFLFGDVVNRCVSVGVLGLFGFGSDVLVYLVLELVVGLIGKQGDRVDYLGACSEICKTKSYLKCLFLVYM